MESGSFQVPNMPIGLVGPLWPPICSAERSWFRDIIQDLEVGDGADGMRGAFSGVARRHRGIR